MNEDDMYDGFNVSGKKKGHTRTQRIHARSLAMRSHNNEMPCGDK